MSTEGLIIDAIPAQCFACKNLNKLGDLTSGCKAFESIPSVMWWGGDHRKPLEGDNGVQFEQSARDGAAEAFADWQAASGS